MTSPSHVVVAGTRRAWSPEQKRAILAEADVPGTSASAVARRHGLHSSLLFRWRRAVLAEQRAAVAPAGPAFVPLALPAPTAGAPIVPAEPGPIEIELAGGHRVRVPAGTDLALLRGVLAALTGR
ncbi:MULTISPECIES: IS66-like element accessory protein TnpA [Methylobacterium]|uniref:Transposase n=1 Tax=Methylobacterium aerolatum TaxID=418708 RepID=A0ABU0I181_9HYPH|nr:transposase [Methylobacterium aerolatum]MDQ0448356.1 transposase [Methylobacterium aerolatum]GJD36419.1 hypothetical protein FMGBMHLM_3339 [Methylobacterium aerolatum]